MAWLWGDLAGNHGTRLLLGWMYVACSTAIWGCFQSINIQPDHAPDAHISCYTNTKCEMQLHVEQIGEPVQAARPPRAPGKRHYPSFLLQLPQQPLNRNDLRTEQHTIPPKVVPRTPHTYVSDACYPGMASRL
ncbi:hypothetical protein BO79DRAFT_216791 [Aspergillus costaricaensis CBS 115574]|uniref:Uncharacterized protein n=1 Tax=Aspergillus costaricaensis CBS 115574 TaxID=1448317 RepID=A0ACD1II00_9EURO|nr:hypothetical protein BO79DRAFT_216791 [Aspergillus costaricaensis CBS 115574]RAK89968.1 hypothetical protein BO79DRAFT_216791 [Aspergillus costaricaensis CBS 115574]